MGKMVYLAPSAARLILAPWSWWWVLPFPCYPWPITSQGQIVCHAASREIDSVVDHVSQLKYYKKAEDPGGTEGYIEYQVKKGRSGFRSEPQSPDVVLLKREKT